MADYSVYPFIRNDKPLKRNHKYPIYLRVRIYDRETKVPTHLDVAPADWNDKKKEPKERTLRLALNSKVLAVETFLNGCIANNMPLSLEIVKNHLSSSNPRTRKSSNGTFYDYYLAFVERMKATLSQPTIMAYMIAYNALKAFRKAIDITDINLTLIEGFDVFLRDVKGNNDGGRANKHKNIKTVILDMIKHDLPVKNPYPLFKMPKCSVKETYLEKSEIELLRKLYVKLPKGSLLFRCLEMYLFACYCGLRLSDVVTLKWNNIDFEKGLIIKKQIKTRAEVKAPLFERARDLLLSVLPSKKKIGSEDVVFGDACYPYVNKQLKELARMAGIDKHLTFHTIRHTFATLLVMDGVSIYKIQKFLGHKSVSMTERYLKYDLKMAQVNMEEIDTFS